MKEIWKDIQGYEGLYQISNLGRVKSLNFNNTRKEKIMKPLLSNNGYLRVSLSNKMKKKKYFIHRLVAQEFIPNPNNLSEINHINEIKTDNSVKNLEYCTSQYNHDFSQSKSVLQYDLEGNFINEWKSANQIQRELGFFQSNVNRCCLKKCKTAYGFIWKYKNEEQS